VTSAAWHCTAVVNRVCSCLYVASNRLLTDALHVFPPTADGLDLHYVSHYKCFHVNITSRQANSRISAGTRGSGMQFVSVLPVDISAAVLTMWIGPVSACLTMLPPAMQIKPCFCKLQCKIVSTCAVCNNVYSLCEIALILYRYIKIVQHRRHFISLV